MKKGKFPLLPHFSLHKAKLEGKTEVIQLEKEITEIGYQHKEDINQLEAQHKAAVEEIKRTYNDRINQQENDMGKISKN